MDGLGCPNRIWRIPKNVAKAYFPVDEAFAWDDGEGDRTC
jgi:hypothetical protein